MNFENKRDKIISELETISRKEAIQKNFYKVRAYNKVIDQIYKIETIISMEDLKNVQGIGEKIREKIQEILQTGELQSAKRARDIPNIEIYNELMKIHGIGIVKAEELVKVYKIKSIDDLIKKVENDQEILNEKQRTGLQYHLDLQSRINRNEIDKHARYLRRIAKKINPHIEIKLVGSYRRGSLDSGDIDIIFTINKVSRKQKNDKTNNTKYENIFKNFLEKLKEEKYLVADLGSGNKKYMGICKIGEFPARRIDILYTSSTEFPFAMLYFTGDFDINVELRKRAKELGYTLSEYGLKNTNGQYLYLNTEKEIFNFLGYKFLQPKSRTIQNLKFIKS